MEVVAKTKAPPSLPKASLALLRSETYGPSGTTTRDLRGCARRPGAEPYLRAPDLQNGLRSPAPTIPHAQANAQAHAQTQAQAQAPKPKPTPKPKTTPKPKPKPTGLTRGRPAAAAAAAAAAATAAV